MAIRSGGMEPKGREGGDAHLLILQAPQAENCSRVVFGWEGDFSGRREVEEDELSEGEPELCLMGIIDEGKRKRETEGKRTDVGHCEVKRTPFMYPPPRP